jgi:hypothetical protein
LNQARVGLASASQRIQSHAVQQKMGDCNREKGVVSSKRIEIRPEL